MRRILLVATMLLAATMCAMAEQTLVPIADGVAFELTATSAQNALSTTLSFGTGCTLKLTGDAAGGLFELNPAIIATNGMHGYAVKNVSDLPPTGGYGVGDEYDLCFRELALARALLACGDFEGAGRKTYEAYARDPRGILRAHAKAVLAAH